MLITALSRSAAGLSLLALLAGTPALADDAMKASPMESGATMKTGGMAVGGMSSAKAKKDCLAKADAETDAAKKSNMAAACDAMGGSAMQSGTMAPKK